MCIRDRQKAKSRLFPFGWYHLVKALFFKHSDIIDLLLVAVLPEYQNKGVNAMLFADLIPICQQMGFKFGETHPQLETNEKDVYKRQLLPDRIQRLDPQ